MKFRNRRVFVVCLILFFMLLVVLKLSSRRKITENEPMYQNPLLQKILAEKKHELIVDDGVIHGPKDGTTKRADGVEVHAFYYIWYGTPEFDGKWLHWNHKYLPPYQQNPAHFYPTGEHHPPKDIAASYYPSVGPYSSSDHTVMIQHMKWCKEAGISVLAVSWYPPGQHDPNGKPVDDILVPLLLIAEEYDIKITLHIEPLEAKTVEAYVEAVTYAITTYKKYPAFYVHPEKKLPLFYLYDSYVIKREEWSRIFSPHSGDTIRNTEYDFIAIGLVVESGNMKDIVEGEFDGFYTYFASHKFVWSSKPPNWKKMNDYARSNSLLFIPSLGPGYNDSSVRPWNNENTMKRDDGRAYEKGFQTLCKFNNPTRIVSITSFNEWHEGTQIEPAKSMHSYVDYLPHTPDYYLVSTLERKRELDKVWRIV